MKPYTFPKGIEEEDTRKLPENVDNLVPCPWFLECQTNFNYMMENAIIGEGLSKVSITAARTCVHHNGWSWKEKHGRWIGKGPWHDEGGGGRKAVRAKGN